MALPSTGITMINVAKILGYYAYPLFLSLLCKHININKWSKWKPIPCNNATLTSSILKTNNYGFSKFSGSTTNVFSWASGGTLYTYTKPSGTSSTPYRLGDFRNYNHTATEPYSYTISKASGYMSRYLITATPNTGADFTMDDIWPATAHTGASLVLLDKSEKTGASLKTYVLDSSIVSNSSYKTFQGYFEIDNSSTDTSQYFHNCVMAVKDGSNYCAIPSGGFRWFEPSNMPQISFDGGTTWVDMSATGGEITVYQNKGNYASLLIRTGFALDVYPGANWLNTNSAVIPASTTNPPAAYEIELILDTATANRYANVSFSNTDYAFNYTLKVNQSVMNPSVSVECLDYHQTTGLSREAIFNVINTSGIVGSLATFYFQYTTSGGGTYTTQATITIPINSTPVTLAVTFENDGSAINSAKILSTATNVNSITFIANTKMDSNGNITVS